MKPRVSAWMDGEGNASDANELHAKLVRDDQAREAWRSYHLIGDLLRGLPATTPGFAGRVVDALAKEPTVLANGILDTATKKDARLTMWSVAAGLAGIAWVGWLVLSPNGGLLPGSARLDPAQNMAAVKSGAPARAAPSRAAAADYLFAHQASSPQIRVPGMAHNVRPVSDTVQMKGGK